MPHCSHFTDGEGWSVEPSMGLELWSKRSRCLTEVRQLARDKIQTQTQGVWSKPTLPKDGSAKCLAILHSCLSISCHYVRALVTDVFDHSYRTYSYKKIKLKHEKAYGLKHGHS